MKYFILHIFLFLHLTGFTQEDYYQLSKNGDKFLKPIYHLHENDFETIKKISERKVVFLSKNNRFLYDSNKHEIYKLQKNEFNNIKIVKPESLYKFEEQEFGKRAKKIKKQKDFKPVPPIKHNILKILILRKINGCYFLYEVEWLNS